MRSAGCVPRCLFYVLFLFHCLFTQAATPPHAGTNQTEASSDQSGQTQTGADRSEGDQASSEKGKEQAEKADETKKVLSCVWIVWSPF